MTSRTRRRRRWLPVVLAATTVAAGLAAHLVAADGAVTLKDGRVLEGDVSDTPDGIVIVDRGVQSRVAREEVLRVELGSYEQRFDAALAAAPDVAARTALGRDALAKGKLDAARRASERALEADPLDRDARALAAAVDAATRVDRAGPATGEAPQVQQAELELENESAGRVARLSDEQVTRIRLAELRPDERATVRFAENVKKRFVDKQSNLDYARFDAQRDATKALQIAADPELAGDVTVTTDPQGLVPWIRRVQPAVLNGCATSGCHNSAGAGGLALVAPARNVTDAYTNFYLLAAYQKQVGAADPGGSVFSGPKVLGLIERGQVEESLLLQYGLAYDRAEYPHPKVQGYDPPFRTANEANYLLVRDWIAGLRQPAPPARDYGIALAGGPATQPAVGAPPPLSGDRTGDPPAVPNRPREARPTDDSQSPDPVGTDRR